MVKYPEEDYREAAKIWKSQNPNVQRIPRSEKIEIMCKEVPYLQK